MVSFRCFGGSGGFGGFGGFVSVFRVLVHAKIVLLFPREIRVSIY